MHQETKQLTKVIVLLGSTASGKTSWSLRLAKEFHGEIISADSRQIYTKMDIGTAKVIGQWRAVRSRRTYYVEDIPHHLIDFLDPGKTFTVAQFRDLALKYIKLAQKHGRLPMIVGGTGLYISSIVNNFYIPRVPPNKPLRRGLAEKNASELIHLLQALDPVTAGTIDKNNKRRLIRALEVCIMSGEPFSAQRLQGEKLFDTLQIGIDVPRDVLHERIGLRIDEMIEQGLVAEIEALVRQRYGWQLPSMSGIGYRQFREYVENKKPLSEVVELLKRDTRRYARRQRTWFRRDPRIQWVQTYEQAKALVQAFVKKTP